MLSASRNPNLVATILSASPAFVAAPGRAPISFSSRGRADHRHPPSKRNDAGASCRSGGCAVGAPRLFPRALSRQAFCLEFSRADLFHDLGGTSANRHPVETGAEGDPDGRALAESSKMAALPLSNAVVAMPEMKEPIRRAGCMAAALVALDSADGAEAWRFDRKTSCKVNAATPLLVGERAIISAADDHGAAMVNFSGGR